MVRRYTGPLKAILMFTDGIAAMLAFLLLIGLRFDVLGGTWSIKEAQPVTVAAIYAVIWVVSLRFVGFYRLRTHWTLLGEARDVVRAVALLTVCLVALVFAFNLNNVSRLFVAMLFVTQPVVTFASRVGLRLLLEPEGAKVGLNDTVAITARPRGWPGLGLGELWRFREICLVLAKRDLKVRYRQTLVGATWAVVQPLLLMTVFTVFFGIFGRLPTDDLPFPVFYLLGLVPWQMVAKNINQGSTSVVANTSLVTRVYVPRAYFPMAVALETLVDLAMAAIPLVALLLIFNIIPGPAIVCIPVFIAIAWIAGLGIAFWLSALNVAYRDISQLLPFLVQVGMFASPIIYPANLVPEAYRSLYSLNPMVLVVSGLRWAVGGAPPPSAATLLIGSTVAVLLIVSGYVFFRGRERHFADFI